MIRVVLVESLKQTAAALAFGAAGLMALSMIADCKAKAAEPSFALTADHGGQIYELDTGLTGPECIARVSSFGPLVDLDGRTLVLAADTALACELERFARVGR